MLAGSGLKRKRRDLVSLGFVLCLGLIGMIGCSESNQPKPNLEAKRISFLHYFSGTLSGGINEMVKAFNEQHNDHEIIVTPLDHEAFKTSIRTTLEAGNPPDVYSYWAGARVVSVLDKLQPIDDVWATGGFDRVFSPILVESACTYSGKKYLLPITQHLTCFFYNRAIFDKLSLKPPATWEEFLQVCETIKKAGIVPIALGAKTRWPAQFWFDYLLLRTAPLEFRRRLMRGEALYSDPEVMKALELWKHCVTAGYFNPDATQTSWDTGANEMVFQGKAAMTLMGTWIMGIYGDEAHRWRPGKDYDHFMFPIIDPNIPVAAIVGIDGLVIPKQALNGTGAKEALLHLAEARSQELMSRGSGAFAPNMLVSSSTYSELQVRMQGELQACHSWEFPYDLCVPPQVAEKGLNAFNEFLEFPDLSQDIFKKLATEAVRCVTKENR